MFLTGYRGSRRILVSFLHFVRHAMRSSIPGMIVHVIAPSYYRGYYRDTEFYDLIVAADLWNSVYSERLRIRMTKKNFNWLEADSPSVSAPSISSSVPLQFRAQRLLRALKSL